MGGRFPSAPAAAAAAAAVDLCGFARLSVPADELPRASLPKSASRSPSSPGAVRRGAGIADRAAAGRVAMDKGGERVPLSEVVADCVRRWFQDTLKEAKAGDVVMQVLVGQMYCSGYGVPRNEQKGKAWILKASQSRSSALKVGDKHPGYNASDSDSDDMKDETK